MYIIPLTILHIRLLHYLSELALEICPHGVVALNATLESKTGQCVRVYAITDSPNIQGSWLQAVADWGDVAIDNSFQ